MRAIQLHFAGCSALNKPVPKSSLAPLTHTHIHQLNPARLLVHLQRQYNPSGLPVRSQGYTSNPTGLPVRSQGCTLRKTPNQTSPPNLSPHIGFCVLCYISYKRMHGPVCVLARCGVESSGIFVALWPTCVVLSRYVSSPVAYDDDDCFYYYKK